MARILSVDKARPALGSLVDEVVAMKEPVIITKRAEKVAVLVSYEEFTALKTVAEGKVKTRLKNALREIRQEARKGKISSQLVDETIQATRGLR